MAKATDIKRGDAVSLNGKILLVRDIDVQNPSARGAATLYKMRFTDVATGLKVEERFKGDDQLETAELQRRKVSFSYSEGDEYVFMDDEDYSQYLFKRDDISEELLFITEEIKGLQVMMINGVAAALELPPTVELVIDQCAPAMKAASATSRTKPASFATGLVVQVPEYITGGEKIKINTADKRYISRAD